MTKATGGLGFESIDNFMSYVLSFLPDASIEQDNEGQLVIYTNLKPNDDGAVVTFSEELP